MSGFGPLASFPLAGSGDDFDLADAIVTTDGAHILLGIFLTQSMNATGDIAANVWFSLADALTASGTADASTLANLIEALVARGDVQTNTSMRCDAAASVSLLDSTVAAWQVLLASNVATTGAAADYIVKLAAIADALAATGQADSNLKAMASCISALALEDLISRGFTAQSADAIVLADTADGIARILMPLADSVLASDSAVPMLRLSCISAESLVVSGGLDSILKAKSDLADSVLVYTTLRIGNTDYVGWALNTKLRAASEYRSFPFDSLASYRGKHYAAGSAGIARLTGNKITDTDAGTPVAAWLRSALIDFATSKFKRVPDAYIGCTADGGLVLKVTTRHPDTGVKYEDWYTVTRRQDLGPAVGSVDIGRGLKSTYWQFELHNVAGSSFDLDELQLRPLILDRRL